MGRDVHDLQNHLQWSLLHQALFPTILSGSQGLMDFLVWVVDSVLHLPNARVNENPDPPPPHTLGQGGD